MQDTKLRASGNLSISRSVNTGREEDDVNIRDEKEMEVVLGDILPDNDLIAETSTSVGLKLSGHEYYGKGTWDRIPYDVHVVCSFKIPCKPDVQSMLKANALVRELAQDRAKEAAGQAMAEHIIDIRTRLFRGLFDNG